MTNLDHRDLDYGQLGNAFYAQERHEWIPQRQSSTNSAIIPLNQDLRVDTDNATSQDTALREPRRSSAIREAAELHPSLRPAAPFISQFLIERAQEAKQVDVLAGDLLAVLGVKTADRTMRGEDRSIRHVVLVTRGTAEDEVRFTGTTKMRSGWQGNHSTCLESDTVANNSRTSWKSNGHAILQLCVPDARDGDGLPDVLAVRLPSAVQLFRPQYTRLTTKIRPGVGNKTRGVSRIDPNPTHLLRIIHGPGGNLSNSCSAHTYFNPFNQAEIAMISNFGFWTIHYISGSRTKILQQGHILPRGFSSDPMGSDDHIQDGWHRIIWCLDSHHILVCNRQYLQLHRKIHDGSESYLAQWSPFPENDRDCITDLRRSTVNDDQAILLTTSGISLIRITDSSGSGSIQILCSWRHYRDHVDISLRLNIVPDVDSITILLYSSWRPLMTQYSCSGLLLEYPIQSDCSPIRLSLPNSGVCGMAVLPVSLSGAASNPHHYENPNNKASYLQVFILNDEFGIEIHMCYMLRSLRNDDDTTPVIPTWSQAVKTRATLSSDIIADDFIVPDDQDSEEDFGNGDDDTIGSVGEPSDVEGPQIDEDFSVPYDDVYRAILVQRQDRDDEDLEQLLQSSTKPDDEVMHLLEYLTGESYQIRDIDSVSRAAVDMMTAPTDLTSPTNMIAVSRLASLDSLGLSAVAIPDASLSTIYSKLALHWLRSLPANTPTRARIAKDKIIRQVAASIFLNTHCIAPEQSPSSVGQGEPPDSSAQAENMDTHESEVEPPSSPPASPSLPNKPHLAMLKRYASVRHAPSTPSNPVSKILSHWTLDSDPSEYDYTSKTAAAEAARVEANMSETDRKKLRRKEERKRQRAESDRRKRAKIESINEPYEPTQQQTQPRPQVFVPEAPVPTSTAQSEIGQAHSQLVQAAPVSTFQVSSQVGPMSQTQPGKFGGRLAFRGRRRAGF